MPLLQRTEAREAQLFSVHELQRRRPGALTLAGISASSFLVLRAGFEDPLVMGLELLMGCLMVVTAYAYRRKLQARAAAEPPQPISGPSWGASAPVVGLGLACVVGPWLIDRVGRFTGTGNGTEMLGLASLAWAAVVLAVGAHSLRVLALSVVSSGFLVLFTTFISENAWAVVFVYAWIVVCLWWLLSNHWSKVDCLTAADVKRVRMSGRWSYLLLTVSLSVLVTGLVWGRFPIVRKLAAEVMPTSGGSSEKDSAARKGVGDGDRLIAARTHASSFGAVDTDLFLNSEKPSLFDVFSEEFGEPRREQRVERAQALSMEESQDSEEESFAETNRSSRGGEFAIERTPPADRKPPSDLTAASLMFWDGESGIRLAAQRFEHFDGKRWHERAKNEEFGSATCALEAIEIEQRTWFRRAHRNMLNSISPFMGALPEALRFTRFRSAEVPTRAGTQMWGVDQLTQADFFAMSTTECLSMPDRLHVPDYTVVRFVNSRIDRERLQRLLRQCAPGSYHQAANEDCQDALAALAHRFAAEAPRGLEQVESVIAGLRREFQWSRLPPAGEHGSLDAFLDRKQGPSYLFATAAALMLDHLGYETRLVSGFYASPDHYDSESASTAILPQDAHVWLEINSGHNYWIPLEPTPGFEEPKLRLSWWYLAQTHWPTGLAVLLAVTLLAIAAYWVRSSLFAGLCWLSYPLLCCFPDRQRFAWMGWMLDTRWLLLQTPRPQSVTPRRCFYENHWGLPPPQQEVLAKFLDAADALKFGRSQPAERSSLMTYELLRSIHSMRKPRRDTEIHAAR